MTINETSQQAHATACNKGFWDDMDPENIRHQLSLLALIGEEVGEAVSAVRKGDVTNLAEELADIIIRVGDMAAGLSINLEEAITTKMAKNHTRPYRHGKLV